MTTHPFASQTRCRASALAGLAVALSLGAGPALAASAGVAAALQDAFLEAKASVVKALVNVRPITEVFKGGVKTKQESVGSGVIFDQQGHIITNYHVAGKAQRVICTLYNQERVAATLVGGDAMIDIAVIQIGQDAMQRFGLVPAKLGDSDRLTMGHLVFAFGSPMALSRSMSAGIVSNPRRYLSDKARLPTGERTGAFNTWIQTDAAINPGNSGGPLVNLQGEVVGINARIHGFAEGLGFAIPINIVKEVASQLMANGRVDRSWLGLEFQPMQEIGAKRDQKGVLISNVAPGSPAQRAGLRVGDVMVQYGDRQVSARFIEDIPAIAKLVADTPVGKEVSVAILRDGAQERVRMTTAALGREGVNQMECKAWGLTVKGITEQIAILHGLENAQGVMVTGTKPGGYAALAGLETNDVLYQIAGREVEGLAGFQNVYSELAAAKPGAVFIKLRRRNAVKYAVIKAKYDEAGK